MSVSAFQEPTIGDHYTQVVRVHSLISLKKLARKHGARLSISNPKVSRNMVVCFYQHSSYRPKRIIAEVYDRHQNWVCDFWLKEENEI